jgi:hypothetical protein
MEGHARHGAGFRPKTRGLWRRSGLILIGAALEPDDGYFLDEVEAALYQAEALGQVMPRDKFIEIRHGRSDLGIFGSMM